MSDKNGRTPHQAIREWILNILDSKGWNPTRLAREARVSPSTISRALNDDRFVLTTKTIEKIKAVLNENAEGGPHRRFLTTVGFELLSKPEIFKLEPEDINKVRDYFVNRTEANFYSYNGDDLALCGIFSGDVVVIDESDIGSLSKRGDIALANIYSSDRQQSRTVLRYYDPPYLLTKNIEPDRDTKPLVVDGETVKIVGRAIGTFRSLRYIEN